MGGVYVTCVADADKGQWLVVTLVLSFWTGNWNVCCFNSLSPKIKTNHQKRTLKTTTVCLRDIHRYAVNNTEHKISSNLPMASTISPAMKMAAAAHYGCQTVCLMADSSATATVSSQREAASVFPIVPNEISITNMQLHQYFHRFPAHRARTGWLHDDSNLAPVCTVWVSRQHIIKLITLKMCLYALLTHLFSVWDASVTAAVTASSAFCSPFLFFSLLSPLK